MYSLIRSFLFQMDPERAHHVALSLLQYMPTGFLTAPNTKEVSAMGLTFSHPIGLAAGLDKNGEYLDGLAKLGFSFIEIGTVTKHAHAGTPKPRSYRVPKAHAIINRMGFNNQGVDALLDNIDKAEYLGILGINIGKNKETALNQAVEDYLYCLRKVYSRASYITINISSPNTHDLRQLQHGDYFVDLIKQLKNEQLGLAESYKRYVPLVVKLSPDEENETLKTMADVILAHKIDGIIATNTTCARDRVQGLDYSHEAGGLSGAPLIARSTECLQVLKQIVGNEVTLIGAGGIASAAGAREKLIAGADLLQVYTGLIYQGPALVKKILADL